jgi:hypothetical protein
MALGEKLCNARLARKQSASDVATATRMKTQVVEAIEKEDFRRIPAPIYAKGFIRIYAEHVGLDPEPLVNEYMERFAGNAAGRPGAKRAPEAQIPVAKILQKSLSAETEPAPAVAAPPAEPDLFTAAPPAPELGAPQVPRFEKPSEPRRPLVPVRIPAALSKSVATAAATAKQNVMAGVRSAAGFRQTAAGLLKSVPARVAVGVAAVIVVIFVASAMSRCSAPTVAPSVTGEGGSPAKEPIELAVDPPAPYVD